MKHFITASNILFTFLIVITIVPFHEQKISPLLAIFVICAKTVQLVIARISCKEQIKQSSDDVLAFLFFALLLWQFFTVKYRILSKMLFPEPDIVLNMFVSELPDMLKGLVNSLVLLVSGYLLALFTAIPLGIIAGWHSRLLRFVNPYAKIIGPIPPLVYIPYAIALLPSFRSASIFVIFIGAFWPIFINTIHGVLNIPKKLIDSASVLAIRKKKLFWRIILPGALPSICVGAELSLLFSFLMLTAAELIGANSGVGWYIRNFGDFGDYPRVISGLIFIGIVITFITWGTSMIEKRLLNWTDAKK